MTTQRDPGRLEDHIAVAAMALLVVITFVNVVVRYVTDQSIAWTEEISSFLMFAATMLATSAAVARDRHIRIETFFDAGPRVRGRRLAIGSAAFVALFFIAMGFLGGHLAYDEFRYEETSPGIGLPKWWYSVWLPILCFAIAIRALGLLQRLRRGEASPVEIAK